jgi:hypothetical protein
MFERLLAALIILALLVLVMFIALPYTPGNDRSNSQSSTPPTRVEPAPAPTEIVNAKPPAANEETVAKTEPAPPAPEKPVASAPERSATGAQEPPVPNPPASGSDSVKPPIAAEKSDRDAPGGNAPPKRKFVKYFLDRLPISASAEPPPKAVPTPRYDRPIEDKPKVNASKADRLRTNTPPRTVQRYPRRVLIRGDREYDDDGGEYVRRTDYDPPHWNRTHYYECANGRCDCSCDRPYWARRGPPCWD